MPENEPVIGGPAPPLDSPEALLTRLKAALAASAPGVDVALIEGTSLADVEASFAALVAAIPPAAAPHVPAGAPGRVVSVPVTPLAKIRDGLARLS
jgi:hypothetical protein